LQEHTGNIVTKNEVFNEIANLRWGGSFLVLDETHFESMLFLNALLKTAVPPNRVYVISFQNIDTPFEVRKLALEDYTSLNDVSIVINQLRDHIGSHGVIIHNYLPHILVREDEESALRMLEFWSAKTAEKDLIEFYTLAQGAFPNLEKKIASLTDGEITIKFAKKEERQFSFTIQKACKPEYHLMEFPFKMEQGELLIKWGEEFTNKLPREMEENIREKMAYLKQHLYNAKLVAGLNPISKLTPHDYILLTQIYNMRLDDIQTMFPDKFDEIIEKIAKWDLEGSVKIEEVEKRNPRTIQKEGIATRIALALPDTVTIGLLHRQRVHSLPIEAYIGLKKSIEAIYTIYLPTRKEPLEALPKLEEFIQEIAARITALERTVIAGEPTSIKLDEKHVPKIISITLRSGFGLKSRILKRAPGVFEINLKDCFLCGGIKSDVPVCHLASASVAGVCSVLFKSKFVCNEIKCKAMEQPGCIFLLKKL
jgi:predicted hydrocarbon binding protein